MVVVIACLLSVVTSLGGLTKATLTLFSWTHNKKTIYF